MYEDLCTSDAVTNRTICERYLFAKLSGPAEAHEQFWTSLAKDVNLDPPEPLERYLGRHHHVKECAPLKYNLMERFESPVSI